MRLPIAAAAALLACTGRDRAEVTFRSRVG
jgi:hypothetical protein